MPKNINHAVLIFLTFMLIEALVAQDSFPVLSGPYLGQKVPGKTPEIFAPGVISTGMEEFNIVISPDGNEIYFSRTRPSFPTAIMAMINADGVWRRPRVTSFSGRYSDMDPSMSVDGTKIFFGSTRFTGKMNVKGCDIWMVEKLSNGNWSKPNNIGKPVNTLENDNYPTLTKDDTIYFMSTGHGGKGGLDIFRSELRDGVYAKPKNLGDAVNSENNDFDAFIASDESYLIFSSFNRPGGFGSGDLYISYRQKDGSWTQAQNMGGVINTKSLEYCPRVSPDQRYFFFTSKKSGNGDIYWMDAEIINQLRPKGLK